MQRLPRRWKLWLALVVYWGIGFTLIGWMVRLGSSSPPRYSVGYRVLFTVGAALFMATYVALVPERWRRFLSFRRAPAAERKRSAGPPVVPPGRKHSE